jgi:hypothetical protein
LKDWYADDNSDAVSFGGDYNDDVDCDLDYEWFVSKSLTHINADRHDIVLTTDLDFIHKKCNSLKLNVALSLSQNELQKDKGYWLLDGGASLHITPHLSDFFEYHKYTEPLPIQTANKNAKANILGEGKVYIQYQIG